LRGSRIDADLVYQHLLAADIVKINDEEAALMAKTYGQPDLCSWLLGEMKVTSIALTHGARGATLLSQGSKEHHPGFASDPGENSPERDNIGAGDSFTALLIRAHLAGASKQATLVAANRYAAFVASRRGATPGAPATLLAELRELMISE
jgi:fructokinase